MQENSVKTKVVEITIQTSTEESKLQPMIATASIKLHFDTSEKSALSLRNFPDKFKQILEEFVTSALGTNPGRSLTSISVTPDTSNPWNCTNIQLDTNESSCESSCECKSEEVKVTQTVPTGNTAIPAPVGNVRSEGLHDLFKGTSWGNKT